MNRIATAWNRFLHGRHASVLTHGSLVLMTAVHFGLLLTADFRWAFLPCVLLAHRIGVMLHEHIHGIPFRNYRHCLAVLAFYDGLLLMCGLLELFRGTHLSHHRWLNREGDSAFAESCRPHRGNGPWRLLMSLEVVQHIRFYFEAWRGLHPYVRAPRLLLGLAGSVAWAAFWTGVGRPDLVWKLVAIAVATTAVPVSLRAAVEHHSTPGDPGFANEYRVHLPLFNLNRHRHHHEQPRCPWYLLEFRTERPLPAWNYYGHWFRLHVRRELVLMRPMPGSPANSKAGGAGRGGPG